jgi:hypothetical protein
VKYNAVFKGCNDHIDSHVVMGGDFIGREVKNREVEVKVTTFKIDTE